MAENSRISWTDHTFNPWIGCTKVGPGCDHCYAEALMDTRYSRVQWGPGQERSRTGEATWAMPLRWERKAQREGRRYRVFCASLADVFDNAVPTQWRMDLFSLIADTPNLDWLLLTKRIGNVMPMCSGDSLMFDMICSRVWLGATVVNQEEADRDIPKLLATPARVRFLSIEPMLGPVDLRFHFFSEPTGQWRTKGGKRQMELRKPDDGGIHWVIAGGESGTKARPPHPDWFRSLRDQCSAAGVAFHFKQHGEWMPVSEDDGCSEHITFDDGTIVRRVGKYLAGRDIDGVEHDGFPG
jgi:protein gp37